MKEMKKFRFGMLLCILIIFLSGCSNYSNKFIGKWSPVNNDILPQDFILSIEKNNDKFVMKNSKQPDQPIELSFVNTEKIMMGQIDGTNINLSIEENSDYLIFKPYTNADPIPFKRD